MRWRIVDLEITPDDLVLATVVNNRFSVSFLARVRLDDRKAFLFGVHMQGAGANAMGHTALVGLARSFMEALDVDQLSIEGATRTSGACPGRRPAPIVFRRARRVGAAA